VSGYRWEDGVGAVAQRPRRLDLAWRTIETNAFGLNEFMAWTKLAGVEPMLAVNLGTRGIQEACDLLEYTNHPSGTRLSDLRRSHGVAAPHGVRLWCLGNEMDGPWQIGHTTADAYGRLAAETAKAMRQVDPRIELVACGSSNALMPTFGQWEATVLDHTFDHVDYISLHAYYEQHGDDRASFLAAAAGMDRFIDGVVATADHIAAKKKSRKRLKLSFDEWNLWQVSRFAGHTNLEWAQAPRLIEDTYTVEDAVVFGSLLMSLLRHADRVTIACLAQLVNVIGPLRTEPDRSAWAQTIFYPFALTARHARGDVLRVEPITGHYDTEEHGEVPLVDVTATHDPETGHVTVLAMNRHERESARLDLDLRALGTYTVAEHVYLGGANLSATNSLDEPERIRPTRAEGARIAGQQLEAILPPVSWNLLRLMPPTE
jgi:alpha-L-arabinofuranosidase